jgi:hypothetical protein
MQHFYNPNCYHNEKYLIYAKVLWEPETEGQPIKQYCNKCLNRGFNALQESVFFWLNRRCGVSKDICTMITNSSKYFPKPWTFVLTFDEYELDSEVFEPSENTQVIDKVETLVITEIEELHSGNDGLIAMLNAHKEPWLNRLPCLKHLQIIETYMEDRHGNDLLQLLNFLELERFCLYDNYSFMFDYDQSLWIDNLFNVMPENGVYTFVLRHEHIKNGLVTRGNKKIYVF